LDLLKTKTRLKKVHQSRRQLTFSSNSDNDEKYLKRTRDVQTQVYPYRRDVYCQVYPLPKVLADVGVQTENNINCVAEAIPQPVDVVLTDSVKICCDIMEKVQLIKQKAQDNGEKAGGETSCEAKDTGIDTSVPDYVREEIVVEDAVLRLPPVAIIPDASVPAIIPAPSTATGNGSVPTKSYPILNVFDDYAHDKQLLKAYEEYMARHRSRTFDQWHFNM
jgi:hypothetical protein